MYRPSDWYWTGTPHGYPSPVIYSSKSNALVASVPGTFLDTPTPWPRDESGTQTVAALDAVLTNAGLLASGLTPPEG